MPQAFTIPLAVVAFALTERRRVFLLPTGLANLCGLLALGAMGIEFMGETLEARLLAGAHLLVYLTWISMFQDKKPRQYWWMCALGVMQVAVASILTKQGVFGILLTGYIFSALWTLSVFSLFRAQQRFGKSTQYATQTETAASEAPAFEEPKLLEGMPASQSVAVGGIQRDHNDRWINLRFAGGVTGMSVIAILIGALFFTLVPRIWIGKFKLFAGERDRASGPLTGFTEEVQLGEIGEILESNERVLQVRCFNNLTNEPVDVEEYARLIGFEEPLFRGKTMGQYENGSWKTFYPEPNDIMNPGAQKSAVRQEYVLDPIGTSVVFVMQPVLSAQIDSQDPAVRIHKTSGVMYRSESTPVNETLRYSVYTPLPPENPPPIALATFQRFRSHGYLQIPPGLDRLRELAADVVDMEPGIRQLSDLQKATILRNQPKVELEVAQKLLAHLRDSGQYSYTLDASITDSSVDPIIDFLFNRRTGHCEYFASALTLMLRTTGIYARLVSGFKGVVKNQYSGEYIVQQRHAHAWVEAYIDGYWIMLDPTPLAREESVASMNSPTPRWSDLRDLLSGMWSQNVVDMSIEQQQQRIYGPLQSMLSSSWKELQNAISFPSIWPTGESSGEGDGKKGGWLATIVVICIPIVLISLVWLAVHLLKGFRQLKATRAAQMASVVHVEFFERFQRLLKSQGLVRDAHETQREFSAKVETRFAVQLQPAGLQGLSVSLVEAFYAIRFGQKQIDASELQILDGQLNKLEAALKRSTSKETAGES